MSSATSAARCLSARATGSQDRLLPVIPCTATATGCPGSAGVATQICTAGRPGARGGTTASPGARSAVLGGLGGAIGTAAKGVGSTVTQAGSAVGSTVGGTVKNAGSTVGGVTGSVGTVVGNVSQGAGGLLKGRP